MKRLFATLAVGLLLGLGACSTNPAGPTYPVVGTVDQKQMEKAADSARLTYFGLLNLAAEYASLPRCGSAGAGSGVCSAQPIVNDLRRYSAAADVATKGAVDIATSPTKTPVALANAVSDAQRAISVFRASVAKVRPAANEVK